MIISAVDTVCEEKEKWLKQNVICSPEVIEAWDATRGLRKRELEKKALLNGFFEDWPILKEPNGFELILRDFGALKIAEGVVIDLPKFEGFITDLLEIRHYKKSEPNIEEMLRDIEKNKDNVQCATALRIRLPSLLFPVPKLTRKYRLSAVDSQDSIIILASVRNFIHSLILCVIPRCPPHNILLLHFRLSIKYRRKLSKDRKK